MHLRESCTGRAKGRIFFSILLFAVALFFWAEGSRAVTIVSLPLSAVGKKADIICLGVLIEVKTTLHTYDYGQSSKAWDETAMVFMVKECLKGALPVGQPCSGTYYLPSFADDLQPESKERECPVIDGSGIEDSLRASETYLFFLDTSLKSHTIIRVEPAEAREAVQKALSSP